MTRLRNEERGGVLVLAAIMIPVFLVLTSLVVDVGNWYTHKRQLQNRADAAAFAAGIEYARNWQACAQDGDLALKTRTAQEIANAARQFAADPEAADYSLLDPSGVVPTALYNNQIARQDASQSNNFLDVVINTENNDYTDDRDYTDDYDGDAATTNGTPCFHHPLDAEGLSSPGHWTDVKVTERDTAALWRPFAPDIHARARVEIRPALSGHKFLPIAIPDNIVTQVQVRYYDQCTGTELARQDLAQLPDGDYDAYQSAGGGSLWAVPNATDDEVGDKNRALPGGLTLEGYDPADCGGLQYRPISEQVRLASTDDVDLDTLSCAQLQDSSFADCFTRLSQIRIWNTGNPDAQPRIKDVRILGGCPGPGDAYFDTLPLGLTSCRYDVSVDVDWGTRDVPPNNVDANFTVRANGTRLALVSWDTGPSGVATYASSGSAFAAAPGPTDISVSVAWEDDDPTHSWAGSPCIDPSGTGGNPCVWTTSTELAHRTFVGKNSSATKPGAGYDPTATGAVESVHTSLVPVDASGALGASFDNWIPSSGGGLPCVSPCPVYPTVGIRSALSTGTLVTLRTGDSQGSQLLACDPEVPNGKELINFRNGCEPWYGRNPFTTGDWWDDSTQECPESGGWYRPPATQVDPYVNSSANPWRCVLQSPGTSAGQTGDWFAVATKNCDQINPAETQCQDFKQASDADVNCANYDGTPSDPTGGWLENGDSEDPRVVSLFIVPYQAFKNAGGSGGSDEIPVLRFASFYVMNWYGQNNPSDDPCPDPDFGGVSVSPPDRATVIGVFVSAVDYESGPVDMTAVCRVDDPTPCRPILVR